MVYASDDPLSYYMKSLARYPLLDSEQEKEIFMQYRDNPTKDIRDKIARSNLKLVVKIASEYNSLELSDRIQYGNMGLLEAIDRFDPYRGYRFSTYACWWIKKSINTGISDTSHTIRLPYKVNEDYKKISRFAHEYLDNHGEFPSSSLIADYFDIPKDRIESIIGARVLKGLNDLVVDDKEIIDTLDDDREHFTLRIETIDYVKNLLANIIPRFDHEELEVFKRRFLLKDYGHQSNTLSSIASDLLKSPEGVRPIESRVKKELKRLGEGISRGDGPKPDYKACEKFMDSLKELDGLFEVF